MAGTKGRNVDAARFAMVPRLDVGRSAFDIRHTHKTTFDAGWLVPIYVDEILPGDTVRLNMTAFARLATPIVPVMDNLILESFFFFVPNRLVWQNWQRFMGEQEDPADSTQFLVPQVEIQDQDLSLVGDPPIADYMGITMSGAVAGSISVNALPFRAYNLIYNTWFRDEDLLDPAVVPLGDGPDTYGTTYFIRNRGKRHDYFTSARPWPQKPINASDSGVLGQFEAGGRMLFPQSGAPVTGIGIPAALQTPAAGPVTSRQSGGRIRSIDPLYTASAHNIHLEALAGSEYPDVRVLINDIRTANTIQLLMERNARGGSRYAEIIRSHFGVVSPDARLQRPEFLGGGRTFVNVAPVAQQSASGITGSTTVLGELAGIGTAVATDHGFSASFTEHGTIIGIVSVRADLTYQHGVRRMWWRRTQFDYYWPALAHLGEQAVLSKEIYCDGTAGDDDVFGYQERWSEYKYHPNRISGRFRSTANSPLDFWHFSQAFTGRPSLNQFFIVEDPPVDRVLQVGGLANEQFLFDSLFDVRMVRPMPMYSIPGLGPRL